MVEKQDKKSNYPVQTKNTVVDMRLHEVPWVLLEPLISTVLHVKIPGPNPTTKNTQSQHYGTIVVVQHILLWLKIILKRSRNKGYQPLSRKTRNSESKDHTINTPKHKEKIDIDPNQFLR